ncbi:MAG: hypothetical protein FWH26_10485 [Oscillospiraceae bacterium]|nr:hypothetical protein [Oscillospiraceae bacterium]
MEKSKKILAVLLAAMLLCAALPLGASAASGAPAAKLFTMPRTADLISGEDPGEEPGDGLDELEFTEEQAIQFAIQMRPIYLCIKFSNQTRITLLKLKLGKSVDDFDTEWAVAFSAFIAAFDEEHGYADIPPEDVTLGTLFLDGNLGTYADGFMEAYREVMGSVFNFRVTWRFAIQHWFYMRFLSEELSAAILMTLAGEAIGV